MAEGTTELRSPLARLRRDRLARLSFAPPPADAAREALRTRLEADLDRTCAELPQPLAAAAGALLRRYGGGRLGFVELFLTPTWSFLAQQQHRQAERAQAHALLLHLLDDHLCDGQLATDAVSLHLRTAAWRRYEADLRDLAPEWIDEHLTRYFRGLTHGRSLASLDDYLAQARDEAALWTAVPRLIAGPRLAAVVEDLCLAWRLLDDLQDGAADHRAGHRSALWWGAPVELRADWDSTRPEHWPALVEALDAHGVINDRMIEIRRFMNRAKAGADDCGFMALGLEIDALLSGL
ncbi:MAG: hypothetical protein KC431_04535 [Myxococcales bacterium]|nr:hypothetical protein [Myxococcales bacterium]